jgi:hypothetical protein
MMIMLRKIVFSLLLNAPYYKPNLSNRSGVRMSEAALVGDHAAMYCECSN